MANDENKPARPAKLRADVRLDPGRLRFSYRPRGCGCSCCLMPVMIVLSFVSLFFIDQAMKVEGLLVYAFAIPFWAAWAAVSCLLFQGLFFGEKFSLDAGGAKLSRLRLLPIPVRRVPLEEIEKFAACANAQDAESETEARGIEIITRGEPQRFGEYLCDEERAWLLWQLGAMLAEIKEMQSAREAEIRAVNNRPDADDLQQFEEGDVLRKKHTPRKPPSYTRWRRFDDLDAIRLRRRGRLEFRKLPWLLFINAFLNGITCFFLLGLFGFVGGEDSFEGIAWWFAFFLLVPFEVMGLSLFVNLLRTGTAPLRYVTLRLGRNFIQRRHTLFGLGPWRTFDIRPLDRIAIVEVPEKTGLLNAFLKLPEDDSDDMSITTLIFGPPEPVDEAMAAVLIDADNREFLAIDRLSKGEARWIGDVILQEREAWFR